MLPDLKISCIGPKKSTAFQNVLKRRAHLFPIASMSIQNIQQLTAVIILPDLSLYN